MEEEKPQDLHEENTNPKKDSQNVIEEDPTKIHIEKNPAEGLQLDINKRSDEERRAYDQEDIKSILQHLPVLAPLVRRFDPLAARTIKQLRRGRIQREEKCIVGVIGKIGAKQHFLKLNLFIIA